MGSRVEVPKELQAFTEAFLQALPPSAWRALAKLPDEERQRAAEDFAAMLVARAHKRRLATKKRRGR
jgi:hypothetical protein